MDSEGHKKALDARQLASPASDRLHIVAQGDTSSAAMQWTLVGLFQQKNKLRLKEKTVYSLYIISICILI